MNPSNNPSMLRGGKTRAKPVIDHCIDLALHEALLVAFDHVMYQGARGMSAAEIAGSIGYGLRDPSLNTLIHLTACAWLGLNDSTEMRVAA